MNFILFITLILFYSDLSDFDDELKLCTTTQLPPFKFNILQYYKDNYADYLKGIYN